ncbi:uncharacterized protein LOC135207523 [Macrobrachium nipponense]|uniref:uncharacterized protein LOC135207523 n=1 Tax=Macrobrachium nipponense TaxID=159736 RepID=UPI0030C8BA83
MQRCCGCCVSLQKGVVAIGVLSMICSSLLTVGYGSAAGTLEEHVTACRGGIAKDLMGILPSCEELSDASTLLAARIFVYVQVSVWLLFFVFSVLLIVGAVKERSGLLVPWLVLSVVVIGAIVWAGVRASLTRRTYDLLACVLATIVCTYCCCVVRAYSRHIKRQALIPVVVPTYPHTRLCCENPYAHAGGIRELPPAYSLHPPNNCPTKKKPLPTGLGVKI